jgi:hypothetical protein
MWFTLAEAQFSLAGITDERTKFYYVLSQLDQRFANEVADVITAPSQHHSYTRLKEELIKRFSPSQEQRTRQLSAAEDIGDRMPSQFLDTGLVNLWEVPMEGSHRLLGRGISPFHGMP